MKWLTKNHILAFLSCPYAFELVNKGEFKYNDLFVLSDFRRKLMERGRAFDKKVKDSFDMERTDDIEKMCKKNMLVRDFSLENEEYGIRGTLDIVYTAKGRLIPIEIKSHREENCSDVLEIAFYWLLLDKIRKRGKGELNGFYIFADKETEDKLTGQKRVAFKELLRPSSIDTEHIDRVLGIIDIIRAGKYNTFPIRTGPCSGCNLFGKRCLQFLKKKKCISLLAPWGSARFYKLTEAGFETFSDFDKLTAEDIHSRFIDQNITGIRIKTVNKIRTKALSFLKNKPIITGNEPLPASKQIIFLDTEYSMGIDNTCRVWFISLIVLDKGKVKKHQFYVHDGLFHDELCDIIEKYPNALVVTWNGRSADFPALKKSAFYNTIDRFKALVDDIEKRHLDLYKFVEKNIAFPICFNTIKRVSEYLGYDYQTYGMGGTDAMVLHEMIEGMTSEIWELERKLKLKKFQKQPETIKVMKGKIKALEGEIKTKRKKLTGYCMDDVESLIHIFNWLKKNYKPV